MAGKSLRGVLRGAFAVLAVLGAHRIYRAVFIFIARRRVLALERNIVYDPDLKYSVDHGLPVFLHNPSYKRSLLFFGGFRVRTMPGMYRDWFERLHRECEVNVVAPVIGLQSMPFDYRTMDWRAEVDVREVVQIYDTYRSALPSDHVITCMSISYGTVQNLAIAALRDADRFILLAPSGVVHGDQPPEIAAQLRSPILRAVAKVLIGRVNDPTSQFIPRVVRIVEQFIPYYVRPRLEGGWDLADPQRREHAKTTFPQAPEFHLRDFPEMLRSSHYGREQILPRVTGKQFLVVYGVHDRLVNVTRHRALVSALERNGNTVERHELPNSAHAVILDAESERVHEVVSEFLERPAAPQERVALS